MPKVYRVILTGGPCGGKSSALEALSKFLTEKGFEVLCVPGTFSLLQITHKKKFLPF